MSNVTIVNDPSAAAAQPRAPILFYVPDITCESRARGL